MSINSLSNKNAPNVVASASLQSNGAIEVRKRKKWTMEMNIFIIREYFRITKLQDVVSTYRLDLFKAFQSKYPQFPVTIQNLADQRRAIMKKNYIPSAILEKIKNDVKLELSINYSDNNEVSNNLVENSVEPQSLPNHNDSFCCQNNSTPNNTIQNDINNLDLSYNDIHVINQNFYYHQNFKEQIEDEFNRTLNEFEHIEPFNRPLLPKQQSSKKFFAMIEILNQFILPKFVNNTTSFKKLHSIIYSGALTIIRLNGSKEIDQTNNMKAKELPKWERRLNKRINNIRRDLGRITQYLKGINSNHLNNCIQSILNKNRIHCLKYNEYNETLIEIKDTLLQKLNIYSKRLKRYKNNKQRKFENKLFRNNEKLFYKNIADNKTQNNNGIPNINEIKEFWSNIWSNEVQFNNQAEWIPNLENEIPDSNNPHHIQISLEILVKNINSSHNWKSPGSDQIHNFWLKKFTCIHKCLLDHFNGFIREPNTFPEFLAHDITYLKPKDSDTKNPSKYRPITCLPTIYKIMTSYIKVIIYDHCQKLNILNEEQKGCVKECFGCKEQLIIDTVIMEQARKNNRNICTAFIDYKKAYDSVPHSWLIKILKIYKINLDLVNFLSHVMTFWRTTLNLSINNTKLKSEPIQIKRGIYQGDSLSPLWFCLAINPLTNLLNSTGYGFNIRHNNTTLSKLNHLLYMDDIKLYASKKNHILSLLTITENFSNDISMSFGIDKCKTQSICRGHYENLEYITKEGEIIKNLNKGEFYKYLGINQSNHIQHSIIKENLEKQFYLRIKSILKSKLNGNNLIKAVNTYAVPLLTYSFGIIKWSKTNLQNINIQTRVLFTKFCKHHPKSAIERFNLPRENGGRGFSNLEILQHNQIASLKNYFLNRARDNTFFNALVSADKGYTPLNLSDNIISDIVEPNIPDTIANIKQKSLHGRYFKELEQPEINIQASHAWLKKSNIHPETEGFIFAIQDRVINTRNYKKHICGLQSIIDKCRICGTEGETIEHIISSCTVLAQSEYKKRHDIFAKIIHMNLAVKFNLLKDTQPHYIYKPESCLENDNYKLYFDRTVLTDIHIQHNRPDIIILNKQQKQAYLLDIAVPNSHNITQTYNTKINKYLELSVAMRNLWCLEKKSILPFIISATGIVPQSLFKNLKILDLENTLVVEIQKGILLYSCHIVRKFLNIDTEHNTQQSQNAEARRR
jgi:hypothetical protein